MASQQDLTPRIETQTDMHIVGLGSHYSQPGDPGIAAQWREFMEIANDVPGRLGFETYGVVNMTDDGFDYVAGVEVPPEVNVPELDTVALPHRRYAVFTHRGNVSGIPQTMDSIWRQWRPKANEKVAKAPLFERYGERFDPDTGGGEVEIWVPLEN